MREGTRTVLTPEAQAKLNEVIRKKELGDKDLEPVVLQQLASYPEEVQKNVMERFVQTGLAADVQNKTGWLVGILKRELKAYQEAIRFRGLEPIVSRKLENALRTRRLRPEEFPSDVIGVLSKCELHQQQTVVDKFLQRHGQNTLTSQQSTGKGQRPFISTRTALLDIIKVEIGPHILHGLSDNNSNLNHRRIQRKGEEGFYQQKDPSRESYRANLQEILPSLDGEVYSLLLAQGDHELFEKLDTLHGPPNFIDCDKLWTILGEKATVDEQLNIMREILNFHRDEHIPPEHISTDQSMNRYQFGTTKHREEFRIAVGRIVSSFGFSGFLRDDQKVFERKGRIIAGPDGVTRLDYSMLSLTEEEWRQEFSPVTKRYLKQFLQEKTQSPALHLNFAHSRVGESIGILLAEFFTKMKPDIGISLQTLNLNGADLQTDRGWSFVALFLLTTPTRELELTPSKISGLSLGVLVHTMFDGEFPQYAPFYETQEGNPSHILAVPNNTIIRFPVTNEPWVKQWLAAGQMLVDSETMVHVTYHYQQLRLRRQSPSTWYEPQPSTPPIHPARMEYLYSKLRSQAYLDHHDVKERVPGSPVPGGYYYMDEHASKGAAKGFAQPSAYYYDPVGYDYYYDGYKQPRMDQNVPVGWRGGNQALGRPLSRMERRIGSPGEDIYRSPGPPPPIPSPKQSLTVIVDVREGRAGMNTAFLEEEIPLSTTTVKKSRNKMPKPAATVVAQEV